MFCIGQKRYDFNNNCQQAYKAIVQLRLEEGSRLLAAEEKRDPDNLIPYFLDNYVDFFQLFFNEDAAQYAAWKGRLDRRLELMSEGPESSPFNLFTRSVIHFQWAAVQIKFGDNWGAAWDFRRSFLQSKECGRRFPAFLPATMLSGVMEVVAGTIPDGYKWLSNLLGIKGSVVSGMQKLDHFITADAALAALYRDEASFYYLYLQFYILNKHEEVFGFIRQHRLDVRNNHLFTYLYANLCLNDQQSALAGRIIVRRDLDAGLGLTAIAAQEAVRSEQGQVVAAGGVRQVGAPGPDHGVGLGIDASAEFIPAQLRRGTKP